MALDPEVRLERFLNGQNLTPAVRLEYFLAGAAGYGLAALQDESLTIGSGGTSLASIPDGANNVPIQSLVVAIDVVQEGTGDPSPDNIRPISGYTGAELNIAKHNIWDEEWTNGAIAVETGAVVGGSNVISRNYISVVPNTEYYATQRIRVFFYDANKTFLSHVDIDHRSFTTPSECRYILFTAFQAYGTTYNNDISINYPATDTEYHAYDGDTYSVTFPETIYGGSYDFVSGKLKNALGVIQVDGTNANNASIGNSIRVSVPIPSTSIVWTDGNNKTGKLWCNMFPEGTNAETEGGAIAVHYRTNGSHEVVFGFGSGGFVASYADAVTWLSTNKPIIVYALATPLEYTLTPATIYTRPGVNNIWASTGNVVAVECKQDPEAAANEIKSIIAPVLPEMKADANLVANDFRIVGDTLYKITANIAAGGTLAPGSNCTATTVAAQLKALL